MTRPTKERKPRAKKTTTVVEEIPDRPNDIDDGPTELDFNLEEVRDTERLTEILEQFPDAGIVVKIYDPHGAYRFTPPDPRNIDPELIRMRCGAGNFVARIYVAGKYRQSIDIPIGEVNPDPNAPKTVPIIDSHSAFLEKMLLTLLARETPHVEAKAPSITEMVSSLGVLDGLRGKQESGLEMYMKGLEMGRSLDGGGNGWDWKEQIFKLVAANAPALLEGVSSIVAGGVKQKPPSVSPTQPISQNATPANPPQPVPEEQPVQISDDYYKAGIRFIKERLLAGMETDTVINWVYDNRDDLNYQPFLKEILSTKHDFEFFVKLDEEIGNEPFRSKFVIIYNGIRSLFNEEYEMGLDTGGSSGNTVNPGSNGKPS
jgi:hypothetical protein